ncbi:MAG: hypothetical protein COV74_08605 [Candidatus Omnitrophica bacterium CG11_big_fil_rev_8_21_14_0_20_45_26]|uniref:Electron transporter RnfD n=1 Tax=Candidatus Abzuiibacterium crystallinum TaxID=1974748 RepID=A0A2H0LMF5_9BACT|nr:MAG: hypothetical protein COV74_08605 [Candidatus Omnitrophica bacterium CG11_big_fil_rev_8_21_14_0_20_45_26]PIW63721.1 MAG: hypothetical protein COW12_09490 [Candidatus Omnitrophica bacterium CG12_big_fil_rev_8_21_14_0_65_45_16]
MPLSPKERLKKTFPKTTSPHWHSRFSSSYWAWQITLGLLPLILLNVIIDFQDTLRLLIFAVLSGLMCDYLFAFFHREEITIDDGSSFLLCLLFILVIPRYTPWWAVMLGVFFVIAAGKACFGGWGQYIFHPSLAGLIFLATCFAGEITPYLRAYEYGTQQAVIPFYAWFFQVDAPTLGNMSPIAVLIGGMVLAWHRRIDPRTPATFLAALLILALLIGIRIDRLFLSHPIALFAFFILPDSSTSPITSRGRIWAGIACALFFLFFKSWLTGIEALAYSVLIINGLTPLLDRYARFVRS